MCFGHAWGCILACNNVEIDRTAVDIYREGEIRQGNVPINHDNSARATPRLVGEIKTFTRKKEREREREREREKEREDPLSPSCADFPLRVHARACIESP